MAVNDPLFAPGLIHESIEEVTKKLIDEFPDSATRRQLYEILCGYVRSVCGYLVPCEFWIDGSFVTNKLNPNDIDLLVLLNVNDYNKNESEGRPIRCRGIDCYYAVDTHDDSFNYLSPVDKHNCENTRNYWRGQFGFDREDNPKGILILSRTEINKILQNGGMTGVN